jgi:16S rRNA G966 N2-methylase RsmD
MKTILQAQHNHQYNTFNNGITPFEIYLKYSTEKKNSIKELSKILSSPNIKGKDILDVGASDGSYLIDTLLETKYKELNSITFIEPSNTLYKVLKKKSKKLDEDITINTINKTFEEFYASNNKKFDIVLASHLYHFPRDEYTNFITQLISLVEKSSCLIWVERAPDDIADFKKKFKTQLDPVSYPDSWIPRNYQTVFDILQNMNGICDIFFTESALRFPYNSNLNDTIAIIEFYLNLKWEAIPKVVQKEIFDYLRERNGILKEKEAILVYHK